MLDLVTGATGFIGAHLAERLLRQGRRVRVLCREASESKLTAPLKSGAEIARGDLRDRASLEVATKDVTRVFHCAGHVLDWGTDREFDEANVRGTESLFESAEKNGVSRFIHFSSIAVFGTPAPKYFDDDSPFGAPNDPYTRTKIAGERVAERFSKLEIDRKNRGERAMEVVVLRPAVVYGPRGTWLEEPLSMIEQNKMFLLGGGRGTCHPCYIENLIDATILAGEHAKAPGRAYIVGDDDPISFRDYFGGIAMIAGKKPVRRSIPLPFARVVAGAMETGARAFRSSSRPLLTHAALDMVTTESAMSMKRIKDELGFSPRYDFHSAVQELRAWYQNTRGNKGERASSAL